jgi:hypothetical protein
MKGDIKMLLGAIYTFYAGTEPNQVPAQDRTGVCEDIKRLMGKALSALQPRQVDYWRIVMDDTVNAPDSVELGFINVLVIWRPRRQTTSQVFVAGNPQWVANTLRDCDPSLTS